MREREGQARQQSRLMLVCLAAVGVLAAVDLLLGTAHSVVGTMTVVPMMACALVDRRATALVSAVSVAVAAGLVVIHPTAPVAAGTRLAAVTLAAVLADLIAVSRERRESRIGALTRVAEVAQKAVLAPIPGVAGPVALASAYRSASDEARVGGDLLDAIETERGLHLIVGDVKGKGLDAVVLAAAALRAFRDAVLTCHTLEDTVAAMDRRLSFQLGDEDFVTGVLATIKPDGTLEVVNCAHPPPLLLTGGASRLLEPELATTPFGLSPTPRPLRVHLTSGDRVLLYTDGLIEARAPRGGFVPLECVAADLGALSPLPDAVDTVIARLRAAAGGRLTDDLALLLLEYRGPAPAGTPSPRSLGTARIPASAVEGRPERPVAGKARSDERVDHNEQDEDEQGADHDVASRARVHEPDPNPPGGQASAPR